MRAGEVGPRVASPPALRVVSGRVLSEDGTLERGWVAIEGSRLADVGSGTPPPGGRVVDVGDALVVPGLVDLHVHGGDGAQAGGAERSAVATAVRKMSRLHARHGTTAMLATTVSDTPERLAETVRGIAQVVERPDPSGAAVAGIHLEGPWLAPARAGAHDPAQLRRPDPAELARLVRASGATVRLLTVAPELDGATELIAAALAAGVTVSVGHTDAGYEVARAAFDAGARHVTHLGNAMRPLDRRDPGPIGAALTDPRVTVEVIADGHHLHPALLRLVATAAPSRMVLVTDAVAAAGLPDGGHRLGRAPVMLHAGRVVLRDRPEVLAGSALTMDRAVATAVASGVDLVVALRAATATPARVAGPDRAGRERGVLRPGATADLALLSDRDGTALATVVAGTVVHDPAGLLTAWTPGTGHAGT
jgi:N-acetylglucosamine-6-phosphate deacetylase